MPTIVARPGKNGVSYRVLIRHHSRFLKTQQSKTFKTRKEAEEFAKCLELDLHQHVIEREDLHIPISTFYDLVARYEKEIQPYKAENSLKTDRHQIAYWKNQLGHLPLTAITPSMINTYVTQLAKTHKPSTVRRYIALLSALLTVATNEWNLLPVNPLMKLRKPKVPRGRVRFLNAWERKCLLQA